MSSARPTGSSVIWAMCTRVWSSMSSNRSPAALRTQSSFSSVASTVAVAPARWSITPAAMLAFSPTMSASRAARLSMRCPPPASKNGG